MEKKRLNGPTGLFPNGKLNKNNSNGDIRIKVGTDKSNSLVIVDFGVRLSQIGLDAEAATKLVNALQKSIESIKSEEKDKIIS